MIDLELHRNGDDVHFWAIHMTEDNKFVGRIGLGDELQLAASATILAIGLRNHTEKRE